MKAAATELFKQPSISGVTGSSIVGGDGMSSNSGKPAESDKSMSVVSAPSKCGEGQSEGDSYKSTKNRLPSISVFFPPHRSTNSSAGYKQSPLIFPQVPVPQSLVAQNRPAILLPLPIPPEEKCQTEETSFLLGTKRAALIDPLPDLGHEFLAKKPLF